MKTLSDTLKQHNSQHQYIQLNSFDDICEQLSQMIAEKLQRGISDKGNASLIVPGGSTPAPLFKLLSHTNISWANVSVCPSDDRWLNAEHDDSNERLIKQSLFINQASTARFISLKTHHDSPAEGLSECNSQFEKLTRPIDVAVLGMGNDGHTASLFPEVGNIAELLSPDNPSHTANVQPQHAPYPRITLTLSALMQSKLLVLLLKGQDKLETLEKALANGQITDMPIRAFLKQNNVPMAIYCAV